MVFEREPQMICEFVEENVGLHAYLVIDSTRNGHSCGGFRILEDVTLEEVKALAKAKTLKYSFLKRNMGGAKAGIILPKGCTSEQRTQILEAFGRKLSPILINKIYIPWTEMNCSVEDIAIIMKAAGCAFKGVSDSSYFTALTVVSAVKAACDIRGIDVSTASVVIEGFGKVGGNVGQELSKWGTKIVGVSTTKGAIYDDGGLEIEKLVELRKRYGGNLVRHYGDEAGFIEAKELLLEMDTDILIPCARPWTINAKNMNRICAKIIVPSGHVPLTEEAEEFLHQKGILCLPDVVCNIGGIFGTALYDSGVRMPKVHEFIMKEFGILVKELIWRSVKDNRRPSEVAQKIAEDNFNSLNWGMQKGRWLKRYFNFGLRMGYRIHVIPQRVEAWVRYREAERILAENIRNLKEDEKWIKKS
jgi:glutamate dehydrogenase (NAD(P)+)